ncbi:hypothetical protein HAHE_29650 [Haloferula helveola]|uniref:LamG-like jellyroll fold domain-containing protein n=1 Tax=Haloferula helveola TaxID=490095 RepID=A0ABM7RP56_9BACT|nr:hypothetical protein HAHE_29650 [Haloferula helveola]
MSVTMTMISLTRVSGLCFAVLASQSLAGLVAHYEFEETTGTVLADSSGNGHDGTVVGSGDLNVSGFVGSGYQPGVGASNFGSVAAGVSTFGIGGNSARTIAFWFNTPGFGGSTDQFRLIGTGSTGAGTAFNIVAESGTGANRVGIRYGNGNVYFDADNSGSAFATGTWYHVAVVYDGSALDLESIGTASDGTGLVVYVDGVEVDSAAGNLNNGTQALNTALTAFAFGANEDGSQGLYPGSLDEVRVYDEALDAAQVAVLAGQDPGSIPQIASFGADVTNVPAGSSVTLSWSASNYDSLTIDPGGIDAAALSTGGAGNTIVTVNETTTFVLTADKAGNLATSSVEISVQPPPDPFPTGAGSLWAEWYRPVDQPVFSTTHGNNHDAVIFFEPELEYPYHLIVSHETSGAYLWRATSFSWDSADWELVADPYVIAGHYEYDDAVKVDGTYYLYESGKVYTYSGDLAASSGNWTQSGTFPSGQCDDIGVFYEDGVFHIFGENGNYPDGFDGLRLSHYTSTTGLGGWTLVDTHAVDPNPDGGTTYGVGDATIVKVDGIYYLFCDRESVGVPYRVTAWTTTDINQPFEYLGVALAPRSGETDDWDNHRIQDADILYVPELKRFIMVCNMMDTDGIPGGSFPGVGGTRVVGTFYSKVTDGGFDSYMEGFAGLVGPDAAMDSDPDNDGATNEEEYCAGSLPDDPSSFPIRKLVTIEDGGLHYPGVIFDRITVDPMAVREGETSASGGLTAGSFVSGAGTESSTGPSTVGAFYEKVVYRSLTPMESSDRQFLRIRSTVTPAP